MAQNSKAKLKLLLIRRMLEEETDEDHGLTMSTIISRLAEEGVSAERKSVYRDLEILREFGLDIKTYQRNPVEYALDHRDFTLSELMLMVDAVASSKFLTTRQADMLIGNIKSLASQSQQEKLKRRIHVVGRIRSKNESVFDSVDLLHNAIRLKKKILFRYMHYGIDGKRHAANDGNAYHLTPVGIAYDGGFYYLTAWDEAHKGFADYRVDRMERLRLSEEDAVRNSAISQYVFKKDSHEYFGRFDGPQVTVTLAVRGDKVEIITDRFGSHAQIYPDGEDARAVVNVRVSPQFFGWVAGMDSVVRILEPQSLVNEYRDYLAKLLAAYKD